LSRANGRYLLASSVVLAVLVPTLAFATGEGRPVEGGTRNPALDPSKAYTAETEIIADVATYGTRQSNKRNGDGGAAIYGCRSNPGTSRAASPSSSRPRAARAAPSSSTTRPGPP
jgi:hypothetical protein